MFFHEMLDEVVLFPLVCLRAEGGRELKVLRGAGVEETVQLLKCTAVKRFALLPRLVLYGKEVLRRTAIANNGMLQIKSEEINKLSNGFYYLDISFGNNNIIKKIVKLGG